MKLFRILGRNIRDSFRSVFRNFSLSLASISCITITLIVVSISIILSYNVNNFTGIIKKDVTVVVFLNKDISVERRDAIEDELWAIENIKSVTPKFKESIQKDMAEASKTYDNIMSKWETRDDNYLMDTYQVKVDDIELIGQTSDLIEAIEDVEVAKYGEGMVEQLVVVFDIVRKVSYGIVVALILVTAFLISNTIKITIYSRKREIDIMRLVGASNTNIKVPFILEGLFLGIIGSILPIIFTTYGYVALIDATDGQLFSSFIRLIEPEPFIYLVSGALLVIGMVVGMFGSWRAVKKHLKI